MPRKRNLSPPSYCLHKASGQAVVRIGGKDHYLGAHGSPESHAEYARLIAEWRVTESKREEHRQTLPRLVEFNLTVSQVIHRYREFAKGYYVRDGKPTKELTEMRYALRPVRILYGATLAREFGPLKLKAVRQYMIDTEDLSRKVVNARVKRIKRFVKWAVSEELVPAGVFHGLATVTGLRRGRTNARETPPVKPVPDAWVDLVVPHLSPQVAAMVQLQRLTGMRPCEVVIMRACDIDMSGDVWMYEPYRHKNEWREQTRLIPLGPKAQEIIKEFLHLGIDRFLFSPRDAEEWRHEQRAENRSPDRKTKIFPCELRMREKRKAAAKKRTSKRPKRDRYDVDSYRRAITYTISKLNKQREKAGQEPVARWYPLQLRHSRGTEIRRAYGIEAAQVSLGHTHADVTQVYAERNLELAIQIARKTG
jgi:site-specific recombinase XerD